ncbi:uncharacterized protein EI90DRAFT_1821572 [Cantharellus anzutake]|uniref:uncharacterized protein n=1 Tax=Cantharellus anzutake TaxID=1750568 RepID=UPI001904F116|nr:uncharacterized protein EI90DRAFT_1821572 [Cantharellus anzutake]KAF8327160.1 hypothetical protein EI90DRAFT_1821572 [Cantharellus anzutake]
MVLPSTLPALHSSVSPPPSPLSPKSQPINATYPFYRDPSALSSTFHIHISYYYLFFFLHAMHHKLATEMPLRNAPKTIPVSSCLLPFPTSPPLLSHSTTLHIYLSLLKRQQTPFMVLYGTGARRSSTGSRSTHFPCPVSMIFFGDLFSSLNFFLSPPPTHVSCRIFLPRSNCGTRGAFDGDVRITNSFAIIELFFFLSLFFYLTRPAITCRSIENEMGI